MANYTKAELRKIYDRTNGNCHLCGGRMAFANYGVGGARSAWEIDHSIPRANGGRDHGNNLYGAHIPCNRSKGTISSRAARARNGVRRAPQSKANVAKQRAVNTVTGVGAGALTGGLLFGPPGALVGGLAGGLVGNTVKVK